MCSNKSNTKTKEQQISNKNSRLYVKQVAERTGSRRAHGPAVSREAPTFGTEC